MSEQTKEQSVPEEGVAPVDAAAPAEGEASAAEAEPTPEEVIAKLAAERDEMRDRMLRALAEAENIRKRAERDRRDGETYGSTRLARDLLAVHDNLERALGAADDDLRQKAEAFIEGVELTQRELLNAFSKHKIEKITPSVGEKFDPNRHQAMFEAPIPGADPGAIIEVMQAGFQIADRLLRPALVGVAKAAPAAQPAEEKSEEKPAESGDAA